MTLHLLGQVIWGDIWKHTLEKSQINAINVTLHPHRQAIWGGIWKHIVEKSQASATYLDRVPAWLVMGNLTKPTMPLLMQAIWGYIWKRTVEKSQINATNVTLHLSAVIRVLWGRDFGISFLVHQKYIKAQQNMYSIRKKFPANTNTNTIRFEKITRIRIRIIFGLKKLPEYEYE